MNVRRVRVQYLIPDVNNFKKTYRLSLNNLMAKEPRTIAALIKISHSLYLHQTAAFIAVQRELMKWKLFFGVAKNP